MNTTIIALMLFGMSFNFEHADRSYLTQPEIDFAMEQCRNANLDQVRTEGSADGTRRIRCFTINDPEVDINA